jgi:rare lipoprotein A
MLPSLICKGIESMSRNLLSWLLAAVVLGWLAGCTTSPPATLRAGSAVPGLSAAAERAAPRAATAPFDGPDVAANRQIPPSGAALKELERGQASWYAPRFHGRRTASGERYDQHALTAAHKTLPFGTLVRVRSLVTGKEVDVRVNDRGPFGRGRVIDVSRAAAEALGMTALGVKQVALLVPESVQPTSSRTFLSATSSTQARSSSARDAPMLMSDSLTLIR